MTGSDEHLGRARERLTALLVDASTGALGAAGGHVAGVCLRAGGPGLLRLSTLVGLPGRPFRPWWRLHMDRPVPVADACRLGVRVVLPNATEMVRRCPRFAAGLPFQSGPVCTPVPRTAPSFGVLTVLRPALRDAQDELPGLDHLGRPAQDLGAVPRAPAARQALLPRRLSAHPQVRLDPVAGTARVARAGRPQPPLRAPDGRTRVLDIAGGVVLGVDPRARYPVTELEPDAIPALDTDGLVERPGADIDDGIAAPATAGAGAGAGAAPGRHGGRSPAGVADRLTATARRATDRRATDRPEDVALLIATRHRASGGGP
ncbi:SpoIIE family protein phosphatase [Streptomyces sp. NPDC101237]|uniref:SpoIIE family protein phosphatase n=1 Tax=Streptomyces sp. NPDC101237 TaxID=3366139 RepID=UPI0037F548C4